MEQTPKDNINTQRQIIYTTFEGAEYFDIIAAKESMTYRLSGSDESIKMGYDEAISLYSPDDYLKLRTAMANLGIIVEPFFPNFRTLTNLTGNLRMWSIFFMILTAFIIITVTIISTIILLNSRQYEIAVLRSVGMRKSRIIVNYLIENLAFIWSITLVSLIAAQFIAPIFSNNMFESMRSLISSESFENITKGLRLDILLQNIGIVFGGTTAVVMLSLILACINIIRFEPLKIFNRQY